MRKITLLITLLLAIMTINAQSQFPGMHPEILLNKQVKVKQFADKYTIYNFHKDEKMLLNGFEIPALQGKEFKVTSVTPYSSIGDNYFKIILENPETGIVYYKYNPKYPDGYMLNVDGGVVFPDGIFCDEIVVKTDTYTGNITTRSPFSDSIEFTKVQRKDNTALYISVGVIAQDLKIKKTGFTIFLANGQKIEKPTAPVEVKANGNNGYLYSVFETLTPKDIALLSKNEIISVKVYVYDRIIPDGNLAMEYLKCITKK